MAERVVDKIDFEDFDTLRAEPVGLQQSAPEGTIPIGFEAITDESVDFSVSPAAFSSEFGGDRIFSGNEDVSIFETVGGIC